MVIPHGRMVKPRQLLLDFDPCAVARMGHAIILSGGPAARHRISGKDSTGGFTNIRGAGTRRAVAFHLRHRQFRLATCRSLCFHGGVITIQHPADMQAWAVEQRRRGTKIGLVPTMGYLHEGHLSLLNIARQHADVVVVSIFVNPTQFAPTEDFSRYPRDLERDLTLCREAGADAVFHPDAAAMYTSGHSTYVIEESLGNTLCGASRPGHFRGVATVVAKLFNICLPDVAVFGEKDAQQLRIIRRMVRDLNFAVQIVAGPTARDGDGLALSSRNSLLMREERAQATALSRALRAARERYQSGERNASAIKDAATDVLRQATLGRVDYLELVDDETLQPIDIVTRPALMAVAVYFSKTRLIDNVTLG
jgi:pantoate--beta-alanine ligase